MAAVGEHLRKFEWKRTEPLHSLLCLPAIGLPLYLAVHFGYPGTGALMAGGAQCVGFGSFQQPLFRRSGSMWLAAVGISLSALVGALCRDNTAALLLATVLWSLIYGLSTSISSATSWVGQQCCVFLIISSAAASTPGTTRDLVYSALLRCAGVSAGALLQAVTLRLLRHWIPEAQSTFSNPDFDPTHFQQSFLREQISFRSGAFQYALRVMLTGFLAVLIYRHMSFPNAYWIGMTAILIPKPDWTQTVVRSLLRTIGTLLGAGVCTLLVITLHPRGEVLTLLVLVFLFFSYLFTNVNYGAFAAVLTGYICFLLAIAHEPTHAVLLRRLGATAAGCGIALGVHLTVLGVRRLLGIAPHLDTLEARMGIGPHR